MASTMGMMVFSIFLAVAFSVTTAYAAELEEFPVMLSAWKEEGRVFLRDAMPAVPLNDKRETRRTVAHADMLTHVIVRYSSDLPVPFTLAPLTVYGTGGVLDAAQVLAGVLPPAQNNDVLLPVYASPQWTPWTRVATITLFTSAKAPPTIIDAYGAQEPLGSVLPQAIRSQMFVRTPLDMTSPNVIIGKRIVGIPTVLCFVVLSALGIFLVRRNRTWTAALALALLCGSLLSDASFAARLVRGAVDDEMRWRTNRTYREVGDLYAVIDALHDRIAAGERPRITACGATKQVAEYLLAPYRLVDSADADTAIAENTWETSRGTYLCGGDERIATSVERFPDYGGILHLSSPAQ